MPAIIENLFQALSLEVSVLEVLLKRHRCSHSRAIYFRRMSMVLQALQRYKVLDCGDDLVQFERHAIEYTVQQRRKRKRSGTEDSAWSLEGAVNADQVSLKQHWDVLVQLHTKSVMEIISRIDYAGSPLFLEISRGFFYPFCTVALGALARIRAVLLRIGQYSLTKMHELGNDPELSKFLPSATLEVVMAQYLEAGKDTKKANQQGSSLAAVCHRDRRAILAKSIGFTLPKTTACAPDASSAQSCAIPTTGEGEKSTGKTPAAVGDDLVASLKVEDDDIGEVLTFTSRGVVSATSIPSGSKDKIVLDRNMEILSDFKSDEKKKRRSVNESSSPKSSKQLRGSAPENKKSKKSKNKKGGDFFDELFS